MLIAQQRSDLVRPRFSLAPQWLGQLALAIIAAALVFGPLLLREAAPHDAHASQATGTFAVSNTALHELLSPNLAQTAGGAPVTAPQSHCAVHCSLASLSSSLLLGTLLLAVRLRGSLTRAFQRLVAPPLSPPPQPAC